MEFPKAPSWVPDTSTSSTIKNICVNICDWLKANKLTLNAQKPEFMIMGGHRRAGTI